MAVPEQTEELCLELLSTGPSSFAALYGFIVREGRRSPLVNEVLSIIERLRERGWLRAHRQMADGTFARVPTLTTFEARENYRLWLEAKGADLSVQALSYDEIGLWFELLPAGRAELLRRAGSPDSDSVWTLDYTAENGAVVIHAADADGAKAALSAWIERNPSLQVVAMLTTVEPVRSFARSDGTTVNGGVRLRAVVTSA